MDSFLSLLGQWIQFLWPFRIVNPWEKGGLLMFGKWNRELGPGIYPVLPWFMDVHAVPIATGYIGTGRQDITLADGSQLSFSATATAQVIGLRAAVVELDDYKSTAQELLSSVLADKLSDVKAERLEPEARRRLLTDLTRWAAEEASPFGLKIANVRFTNFTRQAKVHRLLIDQMSAAQW